MCGIVGKFGEVMKPERVVEICKLAWEVMKHRGSDSYGIIGELDNGKIWYAKSLNKKQLLKKIENLSNSFKWFIAHNRKASVGSVTLELAHPIVYNKLAVIHNGTKKYLSKVFNTQSDTEAIAYILTLRNEETIKKLLSNTGVIFAIRGDKKIYFHKDKSRPLVLKSDENLFSSEPIKKGKWKSIKNADLWIQSLSQLKDLTNKSFKAKFCNICNRYHSVEECKFTYQSKFNYQLF